MPTDSPLGSPKALFQSDPTKKILLLGPVRSGKTTLCYALARLEQPKNYHNTIGVEHQHVDGYDFWDAKGAMPDDPVQTGYFLKISHFVLVIRPGYYPTSNLEETTQIIEGYYRKIQHYFDSKKIKCPPITLVLNWDRRNFENELRHYLNRKKSDFSFIQYGLFDSVASITGEARVDILDAVAVIRNRVCPTMSERLLSLLETCSLKKLNYADVAAQFHDIPDEATFQKQLFLVVVSHSRVIEEWQKRFAVSYEIERAPDDEDAVATSRTAYRGSDVDLTASEENVEALQNDSQPTMRRFICDDGFTQRFFTRKISAVPILKNPFYDYFISHLKKKIEVILVMYADISPSNRAALIHALCLRYECDTVCNNADASHRLFNEILAVANGVSGKGENQDTVDLCGMLQKGCGSLIHEEQYEQGSSQDDLLDM